jgi:Protein of unknown function, DUF481
VRHARDSGVRAPWLAIAIFAALLPAPATAREKTDVIVLKNGDQIHGEIKSMSRGKLSLGTDDAGTLSIEWVKVAQAISTHSYEVEMSSGAKHFGALTPPAAIEIGVVVIDGGERLPVVDVVGIVPIDDSILNRVKAYLDAGLTLAKSNQATTFTADGQVAYRGTRFGATVRAESYAQGQQDEATVSRNALALSGDYYFARWRATLLGTAENNDELDLQFRFTLGGSAAYSAVRSNAMELWTAAGLVVTRENYAASTPHTNGEAYFNGTWEAFRYDSPKLDLGLSLSVFPSLTDFGRVRGDLAARLKYELFKDFNAGFNLSTTFDSRPPDPAAPKTDYVLTLTIGWSYRR